MPYFGYTGNAITDQSLRWSMGNVLPEAPGTDIENVIYSYKIDKETGDLVRVHVYNENADNTGYVFRETDEWKPGSLSGTQINKVIPLGRIHRDQFGDGGIDVEGPGLVYDANVVYTYRIDPCYDPQFDPNCPGYKLIVPDIPEVNYEYYDASEFANRDQFDDEEYNEKEEIDEEKLKEEEEEEEKDREERLEEALLEAGRSALFAEALAASQIASATQINLNSYTTKTIRGGVYNDTVDLKDVQLPDAKSGLRNGLAQQLLHQKMVEMQYNNINTQ